MPIKIPNKTMSKAEREAMLRWKAKRPHESIMRKRTFKAIERKARAAGYADPKSVAGRAYWRTVEAKWKRAKGRAKQNGRPGKYYVVSSSGVPQNVKTIGEGMALLDGNPGAALLVRTDISREGALGVWTWRPILFAATDAHGKIHKLFGNPTVKETRMRTTTVKTKKQNSEVSVRGLIVAACARTLWALEWGDKEAARGRSHAGQDLMRVAPVTPARFYAEARKLVTLMQTGNGCTLEQCYSRAASAPGKHYSEPTPEEFGYGLAMAAHGHGAGWWDNHPQPKPALRFPLVYV